MVDDDKSGEPKKADDQAGKIPEPYVMAPNVPEYPEPKRRKLREKLKEASPHTWAFFSAREPKYEFDPDSNWGNSGVKLPRVKLEHPSKYGLKNFSDFELHLPTGEYVTAWYKRAKKGFPTIVCCHGNSGSLAAQADFLKEFSPGTGRGFGVIIAAYPGFPGNKDHGAIDPSEEACNATGYAMVRDLLYKKKVPMNEIVLLGHSLGGAVALRTAHNIENGMHLDWGGGAVKHHIEPEKAPPTICLNTFNSFVKRVKEARPLMPVNTLMTNRFESDQIIGDITSPVLLIHGKADPYTHYRHSVELQEISGGGANGSGEFHVGKLVKHILLNTDDEKSDAFKAIDRVIGTHLHSDVSIHGMDKKEEITKIILAAIQAKYPDAEYPKPLDKFEAFLQAVQRPDTGLPSNNSLKSYKGHADLELMDGITHSCDYPRSPRKVDPRQLVRVADVIQEYLHKLNMCPAPPVRTKEGVDGMQDWEGKVTGDDRAGGLGV